MEEQALHSEISTQAGPPETPPGGEMKKEQGLTDPQDLSQLLPVALLRS